MEKETDEYNLAIIEVAGSLVVVVCASSVNYPVKFGLFPKHFKVAFARARKPIHLVVHLANPNSPLFCLS